MLPVLQGIGETDNVYKNGVRNMINYPTVSSKYNVEATRRKIKKAQSYISAVKSSL